MKNEVRIGSILSYINIFINIIISLIYTPIMVKFLGTSEYGLYNSVSSTISTLSLLSLGFSSGYIYFYAKYKINDDEINIHKLNGLFLIIFTIIGIVAFTCGFYITENLHIVFDNGLTVDEYLVAKKLSIILTIGLTLFFPFSVFSTIIISRERFIFLKSVSIFRTLLSPLLNLPLLLLLYKS